MSRNRFAIALLTATLVVTSILPARAQDMVQYLDLKSDEFTKADMTRADIEAALASAGPEEIVDLSGKRLNKLDLSKLDLRRVKLQSTRINGVNLSGANLEGVILDQAWALESDLTDANLKGANLFGTQLMGAKLDGADLTSARIAADFSRASATGAKFDGADLSADMKNQSMGLMRGVFKSTNLDNASFTGANMMRVALDYASLRGANLKGAKLNGSEMAGADLTGANVAGADFAMADVHSAKLLSLEGDPANLDRALNLAKAYRE